MVTNIDLNNVLAPFTMGIHYNWVDYSDQYSFENLLTTFIVGIHYSEVGCSDQYSLEQCINIIYCGYPLQRGW